MQWPSRLVSRHDEPPGGRAVDDGGDRLHADLIMLSSCGRTNLFADTSVTPVFKKVRKSHIGVCVCVCVCVCGGNGLA